MDMYVFGHFPMPVQGFCEAVALRLVTKIDGNADLYSGGRPVAPSFSSSRFECGSLCLQLQAKRKGSWLFDPLCSTCVKPPSVHADWLMTSGHKQRFGACMRRR